MEAIMINRVRELIAADKLEAAISVVLKKARANRPDVVDELTQHQATLKKNRDDLRRGLITSEQENLTLVKVRYAVLEIASMLDEGGDPPSPNGAPEVFISYNHEDGDVAARLRQALEKNNIIVRIDQAVMTPGEDIQSFIERAIRETDVTLSIVSNHSLLSAWVALESIYSFYQETLGGGKKFIACYLDTDFFQDDFRLKATKMIDAQIRKIDQLILQYIDSKIDTNDLNSKKSRLFKLRNNLGDILIRLRDSLSLDIREECFQASVEKIIKALI